MYTVLLVIHTIVVLFMIALILIQRSDADGMGLSGGGGNQFLSGRSQANLLTRTTAILATIFLTSSLALAIMAGQSGRHSVVDSVSEPAVTAPANSSTKDIPAPAEPAVPKPE